MIGFYWEFNSDEPCKICGAEVKTMIIPEDIFDVTIKGRRSSLFILIPFDLLFHYICRDCWLKKMRERESFKDKKISKVDVDWEAD